MTTPQFSPIDELVRSSKLIQTLESKLVGANQTQFDYLGELHRLAKVVAPQIALIPRTFPQYTPHDWTLHVRRLFGLSDRLIGEESFATMHPAELFVLAASLYAHDWGMGVSDDERNAIVAGGKSSPNDIYTLLNNESNEIYRFAKNNGLEIKHDGSCPAINEEDYWKEYVRLTHAWRSGSRARRFFEESDGGIAQSVAAACEGHWLDLSIIDSESRFPAILNVLDQRINLRAIVIYVRLVDLFDIGEDRTPYALWRFVAPRNNKASLEWSKHRSLRPVNVEPYQPGRRIVVDGTASDPDLWASLLDLRDYIEQQLRNCMELLARHPDPRHTLDLAPIIKWNVKPQGFTPIQIRFEFDRSRMFEILSDEIYQGDEYIFLRELLQNSIDAIKVRRLKQSSRPQDGIADGLIEFKVVHGKNGDATVICCDNGIGMDEYILRNYFAVAGLSYYRSPDFEKEGLKFDPISRFGIGILSCFMVADSIEITTYRDPRFYSGSIPLKLIIPAIDKQFRVYPESPGCDVGTRVVVNVQGSKIKKSLTVLKNDERKIEPRLNVTEYLSAIAGFVEYPILVEENGQRTVIAHPDMKPEDIYTKFGKVLISQMNRNPILETFVVPQNIHDAKHSLLIKTIDLSTDLVMEGFEGWVNFVIPKNPDADFGGMDFDDGIIMCNPPSNNLIKIRWEDEDNNSRYFSRSCSHPFTRAIYQKGILIPYAENDEYEMNYNRMYSNRMPYNRVHLNKSKREVHRLHAYSDSFPRPCYRIGLKLLSTGIPDISRTELVDIDQTLEQQLRTRLVEYLWNKELQNFQLLDARKRFLAIGRFAAIYQILDEDLVTSYLANVFPIPYLKKDGSIDYFENINTCPEEITVAPDDIIAWVKKHGKTLFFSEYSKPKLKEWRGDICLLASNNLEITNSEVLSKAFSLVKSTFNSKFRWSTMRFLHSAIKQNIPIKQVVWKKREINKKINIIEFVKTLSTSSLPFTEEQVEVIENYAEEYIGDSVEEYYDLPNLYHHSMPFYSPFDNYFALGNQYLNLNHKLTQALLRCHFNLIRYKHDKMYTPEIIGNFTDALSEFDNYLDHDDALNWEELNQKLATLSKVVMNLDIKQWIIQLPSLSFADFIPGTLKKVGQRFKFIEPDDELPFPLKPQLFGKVITQWPTISENQIHKSKKK